MLIHPHSNSSTQHVTRDCGRTLAQRWDRRPRKSPRREGGDCCHEEGGCADGGKQVVRPSHPETHVQTVHAVRKLQTVNVSEDKGADVILAWGRTSESALKSWTEDYRDV